MLGLLVRAEVKYLADAVVVVPLLEELLLVGDRVTLDEVLQLWEVCGEENATAHGGNLESSGRSRQRPLEGKTCTDKKFRREIERDPRATCESYSADARLSALVEFSVFASG